MKSFTLIERTIPQILKQLLVESVIIWLTVKVLNLT